MEVVLSIVIVNYNTPQLCLDSIDSIKRETKKIPFEIIIVDNASSSDDFSQITNKYPEVVWIQNNSNEGFARANNQGINIAKGKYVLLLNPDTLIINSAIEELIYVYNMETNEVGMVSCQLLNEDGTKQKSTFYYNASFFELISYNLLFDFFYQKISRQAIVKNIKALSGACLFFEKEKLQPIGFFDPDFFMYSEEFEWCRRITQNGFKLVSYDTIEIIHLVGASSISEDWNLKQRLVSVGLLFRKSRGIWGYLFFHIILCLNFLINFFLMWKLDRNYRMGYFTSLKRYISLSEIFISIFINSFEKPVKVKF